MKKNLFYPLFVLAIFTVFLAACGSQTTVRRSPEAATENKPQSPKALLRYYEKQSSTTDAERKAYYQLLASEILLDQEQYQATARKLRAIDRSALRTEFSDRVLILEARLATLRGQYPLALQKLPKNNDSHPGHVKYRLELTRAIALQGAGYSVDSILSYIKVDEMDPASPKQKQYHTEIWKMLSNLSDIERSEALEKSQDPILKGWIQLSNDMESGQLSGYDDNVIINSWKQSHVTHPAYSFADSIIELKKKLLQFNKPEHIALILPFTDKRYQAAAAAIRNGFLAAHYSAQENKGKEPQNQTDNIQLSIVDINQGQGSLADKINQLKERGIDMVVGPLAKSNVEDLLQSQLELPVLTLNQSQDELSNEMAFQFGLIPENEARQAAELAISRGENKAAALYPKSTFGERLYLAFKQRYEELGGELLSASTYIESASDHKAAIQQLFNIHQSHNRQAILASVLRRKPEFEPRHRKDIQAIFLIANSVQGRLLKPQLKFHNIIDIPVYATSRIYAGKSQSNRDRDLNGIVFTETPWLMHKEKYAEFTQIQTLWPKTANRFSRLFAMGIDAYQILPHLQRLQSNPIERYKGVSGSIFLNEKQQLQRELVWAQFKSGEAEPLGFTSLNKDNVLEKSENVLPQ